MRVRTHLLILIVATLLPILAFSAVMVALLHRETRLATQRGLVETARALSVAIDREVQASISTLSLLATSDELHPLRPAAFDREARVALRSQPAWDNIVLVAPSGQQLVNLHVPLGRALPSISNAALVRRIVDSGMPAVSNLFTESISGRPGVAVGVPVFEGARVRYALLAGFAPDSFTAVLRQQRLPPESVAALLDGNRVIIGRSRAPEQFVGQLATPDLRARVDASAEGAFRLLTKEGVPVYAAFSQSPRTAWTVATGVPVSTLDAPLRHYLALLLGAGAAVAALCLAIGGILGRRLSGSILSLASAAPHLDDGRPLRVSPTPVQEVNQVAETIARAVDRIRRDRRMADAVAEVARLASQSLEPGAVARAVVEELPRLLDAKMAALYRVDERSGASLLEAGVGSGVRWNAALPAGSGAVGRAIATGRPVVTPDLLEDPEIRLDPEARANVVASPYRAALAVPLALRGTVIGALAIGADAGRVFSREEIALAERFAGEVAVAFERARLYAATQTSLAEMQRAYEELAHTKEQLTQSQKMEAIGRLAGGVAHDFNNLLTVILGRSELLRRELASQPAWRRHVDLIHTTADRAAGLTRQLLAFSRKQVLQPKRLDPNAVIGGMAPMLGRLIGEDIELVIAPRAHAGHILVDPSQLEQVILNLVVNARDAMPDGGRLTIQSADATVDDAFAERHPGVRPGAYVVLSVSDTGVGMDAATRSRIFEPFFTTKEPGKGTGLGLASVYGIVKQSDGYIAVESEPGHGATFRIYLPRVDATDAEAAPPPTAPPGRGTAETILLVEDDPEVRELVAEILGDYGYRVVPASRPAEALELGSGGQRIDLLLTDVVMPEMSGRDLAARLTARHPALRVLYMSGYSDEVLASRGVIDPGIRLLMKPFTPEALTSQVREALDAVGV